MEASGGGVDYAFETSARPAAARAAFLSTRARGAAVLLGIPRADAELRLPALSIPRMERRVLGSIYGSARPDRDFPLILDAYRRGRLPLDRLISHRLPLEQAEDAIDLVRRGDAIRAVITLLRRSSLEALALGGGLYSTVAAGGCQGSATPGTRGSRPAGGLCVFTPASPACIRLRKVRLRSRRCGPGWSRSRRRRSRRPSPAADHVLGERLGPDVVLEVVTVQVWHARIRLCDRSTPLGAGLGHLAAITSPCRSGPRPQLAPAAATPSSASLTTAWAGLTPIIVRRLVSKLIVAAISSWGAASRAPRIAASTSAGRSSSRSG